MSIGDRIANYVARVFDARIRTLERMVTVMNEKIAELSGKLEEIDTAFKGYRSNTQEKISELTQQTISQQGEINTLTAKAAQDESTITAQQTQIDGLVAQVASLQSQIDGSALDPVIQKASDIAFEITSSANA